MSIGDVTCVHIGGHPAEGSRKKLSGTGRKKAFLHLITNQEDLKIEISSPYVRTRN
jgi:hypothetical protein